MQTCATGHTGGEEFHIDLEEDDDEQEQKEEEDLFKANEVTRGLQSGGGQQRIVDLLH